MGHTLDPSVVTIRTTIIPRCSALLVIPQLMSVCDSISNCVYPAISLSKETDVTSPLRWKLDYLPS